jgi:chromosome segregation ATPase
LDQIRCYGDQDSCHILYRHRNSNLVHKIIEIQPSKQKNLTSLEQSPRSLQSSLIDHDLQKILVTWSQKTGIPLTDIQKTIDTYHKNINQLQKKYDDLAEQKKDAETHIKQLTEDIKKITQANQQLVQSHSTKSNTSHQEQQDIVEKLKQQYTALLEQKNVCEKDLSVLRSKHAVLERKLSHYESENKQLQIQLDELKQQTPPSSNMHSDQSVTPSSPTIDQEQLQQKIVSLEAELKQHYQQYQNLTQENKKLTNQIE